MTHPDLQELLERCEKAIWDAVEGQIDAAETNGISARNEFRHAVRLQQLAYVDGLRAGRLASLNALKALIAKP